jgi:hypothetical protein
MLGVEAPLMPFQFLMRQSGDPIIQRVQTPAIPSASA